MVAWKVSLGLLILGIINKFYNCVPDMFKTHARITIKS